MQSAGRDVYGIRVAPSKFGVIIKSKELTAA
jgi:hypothetical protein